MRSFATSGGVLALCLAALAAQAEPVRYSLAGPEPPHATIVGPGHRYRGFVLKPGRSLAANVQGPGVLRLLYFQDYVHGHEFPGTVRVMVALDQAQQVKALSPRAQARLDYRPRRRNRTRPSEPIPILLLIRAGTHSLELRLPPAVPYPATVVFENARRAPGGLGLDLGLGPIASNSPPPRPAGNLAADLDLPPAAPPPSSGLDLGLAAPAAPAPSTPTPASGGLDLGLAAPAPAKTTAAAPPTNSGLDLGLAAPAAPTPSTPPPASGGLDLGLASAAPAPAPAKSAPAAPPASSGLDLGLAAPGAPAPSASPPASGGLDLGLASAAPQNPTPAPSGGGLDLGLSPAAPANPAPPSGGLDLGLAPAAPTPPPGSGPLAVATTPAAPPATPLPPAETPAPHLPPAVPPPSTFVATLPSPTLSPPPVSPRPHPGRRWHRRRRLAAVRPGPPPKLGAMEIGAQAGFALARGDLKGGQGLYLVELGYRLSQQGHPNFRVVFTSGYSLLSGSWTGIDPGHGLGSFYQNTTLIPMELGFTWEPWGPGGVSPYAGLAFASGLASTSLQRFSLPQAQSLGATLGVTAEVGLRLQAGIGSFVFEVRHTESVAGLKNLAQLAKAVVSASALTGGYLVSF